MKKMGEIIAQKRKEKGMTQATLATKMNVTDKAVSKWERDLSCPDVSSLATLAEVLDMPVADLLEAKNIEAPKKSVQEIIVEILKAIALAMGVAVTVLAILGEIDTGPAFILLGIGVASLGIVALNDNKK
jgi:transcriptional regulator with XRE-family HTH domain